jgi:5,10-methylenetetrahydromethanopterin reductase
MDNLARGCARAGRSVDDLDRPQLVVCSVDEDREKALDAARLLVTQYLGQQPHLMKASGVGEDVLEEIHKVLTWPATHDEVVAASKLVPDEIVQLVCAAGTAEECRDKVAQYLRSGATCAVLYPLGDVEATIEAFTGFRA